MMHFSKANAHEARKYRFFVDGVEVTNRVMEADDVEGYAECLVIGEQVPEKPWVAVWKRDERGEPVTELLTGKVEFRRIEEE